MTTGLSTDSKVMFCFANGKLLCSFPHLDLNKETDFDKNINAKEIHEILNSESLDEDRLMVLMDNPDIDLSEIKGGGLLDVQNTATGRRITFNGYEVPDSILRIVQNFNHYGGDTSHLAKFVNRLFHNTSMVAREETFKFLQNKNLPITSDGRFIAYKSVRNDFTDHHTGTIDNSPGAKIPRMRRCDVDDNNARGCSHGYHVGSIAYAKTFRSCPRMIACLVDPRDIVCVPNEDYGKVRVTYYEPIKEVDKTPFNDTVSYDPESLTPIGDIDLDNEEEVKNWLNWEWNQANQESPSESEELDDSYEYDEEDEQW